MIKNLEEGVILHKSGKFEEAKKIYEEIIKKNPNNFEVINLLGIIFLQLKKYDEATLLIKKAIKINPNHHALYNNLGVSYKELEQHEEAIKNFKKAIELNPDYAEAYNNLGITLKNTNQHNESYKAYEKAIELKPNYAEAYNNLGLLYKELKEYTKAIICFDNAILLNKNYYQAYKNRSDTNYQKKEYLLSIKDYKKIIEINPQNKDLYKISIFNIRNLICDWKDYEKQLLNLENQLINNKTFLDSIQVMKYFDSLNIIKSNTANEARASLGKFSKKKIIYKKKEKIKIGYYSADFRNHPVGHLISDLLESHDKDNFEIIGFYFDKYPDDEMTKRIASAFNKFYYTKNISDENVVLNSRKLEIDIAVDLMGCTNNNKKNLFSKQLAPIQINFLGHPGTTNHNNDYIIADNYLIPDANKKFYFEKIIYMPDCYQPSDSKRNNLLSNSFEKEFNFKESAIKFCCLNEVSKINPLIFNCWMQILKETKNSILFLLESNKYCKDNLLKEAARQNIPSNRIIFLPKISYKNHLKRFELFDLFLDTFPYCAHTTANEALWSGVPIISLVGQSFQSRVSSSLLTSLGMDELITTNIMDYKNLAILLANNPLKLKEIKSKLNNNKKSSNLFKTKIYVANLEKAYKQIYNRHQNNLEPENIYLN